VQPQGLPSPTDAVLAEFYADRAVTLEQAPILASASKDVTPTPRQITAPARQAVPGRIIVWWGSGKSYATAAMAAIAEMLDGYGHRLDHSLQFTLAAPVGEVSELRRILRQIWHETLGDDYSAASHEPRHHRRERAHRRSEFLEQAAQRLDLFVARRERRQLLIGAQTRLRSRRDRLEGRACRSLAHPRTPMRGNTTRNAPPARCTRQVTARVGVVTPA